jgi:2'-5' RNA ligase
LSILDASQEFRLFIALPVPDVVKNAIETAQDALRRVIPDKTPRWTRREQFHLTLRFLGNVAASRADDLVTELRRVVSPFSSLRLTASGIGFFPDGRFPRVAWVGINDKEGQLAALWKALQSATQSFTKEAPEHKFSGHVTLARLNRLRREQAQALTECAAGFQTTVFGDWIADRIELMRSELLPQGSRHSLLSSLPLDGNQVSS